MRGLYQFTAWLSYLRSKGSGERPISTCESHGGGDHPWLINISPTIRLGVTHTHHHGNELTLASLGSVHHSAGAPDTRTYWMVWCVKISPKVREAQMVWTLSTKLQTDKVLSTPLPVLNWQEANWAFIWINTTKHAKFFTLKKRKKNLSSAESNRYPCFHD